MQHNRSLVKYMYGTLWIAHKLVGHFWTWNQDTPKKCPDYQAFHKISYNNEAGLRQCGFTCRSGFKVLLHVSYNT